MRNNMLSSYKKNIIRDFAMKRGTYFYNNYQNAGRHNYLRRMRRERICKVLSDRSFERVLDIGCGPVVLYPCVLENCGSYYAVDLTQSNLDRIRSRHPGKNIITVKADIDDFTWNLENFDAVICAGALEYTERPYENIARLFEMLKPGGMMLFTIANALSPYLAWSTFIYNPVLSKLRNIASRDMYYYPRKLQHPDKVISVVRKSGARRIGVEYIGYKFIPQPFDRFFSQMEWRLEEVLQPGGLPLIRRLCVEVLIIASK